ncbi:MAG: hypothetical protein H0V53_05425 [Rubrobacter sp.]|nr:hypothetical protein [Rubrobacter sp.]
MEALEPRGQRFQRCLERFRTGHSFNFRGVNFWLAPDRHLEVRVHPAWRRENTAGEASLCDLEFAKAVTRHLSQESPVFAREIEGLTWRFVLLNEQEETAYLYCPSTDTIIWSVSLL